MTNNIEIIIKSGQYINLQIAELEEIKTEIKTETNKNLIDEIIERWEFIAENFYLLSK